jgi:hypothetical protein
MEINALLIHAAFFSLVAVFFYFRLVRAQRLRSSYALYKVRDELVFLVASGVLEESDPVFSFYYKRVNAILSMAPDVGIDRMLRVILKNSTDVENSLAKAKKEVERILNHESAQREEVRSVIEGYYKGVRLMMLTHSSVFRMFYILARHINPLKLENLLPKSFVRAYKVTRFAEIEACDLHRGLAHSL